MTTPDEKTFATLTKLFEEEFGPIGDRQVLYVHAPGRSEISGNHTDHEGGHVIAGSLDVAVDGIAVATDSNKVRVADEGYPTFEITLDTLDIQESEKGTSASLVRGMAHEIAALGVEPQGFDFAFTCSVPSGGGLSSSAAVEAAYGRAMETLWGAPAIEPVALAQMSQRTENNYYGKPCGLMDQAAVCLGGLAYMDFEDQAQPKTQKLELNFEDHGYALVLVKVGADHVAATDDYAAVPREMQDVAAEFGKARLCEVNVADFDAKLPELRAKLGDRACLRAVHYWMRTDWSISAGQPQTPATSTSSGPDARVRPAPPCTCRMLLPNWVPSSLPCTRLLLPSMCSTAVAPFVSTAAASAAPSRPSCRSIWSTPSLPR
ncbi:MAG: galactokinase [Collinsella aerofaciens]